jgi:hypothetical protein
VKPSNGRGVGGEGVVVIVREVIVAGLVVAGAGRAVTNPESSGPLLLVEGLGVLLFESVRAAADALLGGGGGFEEVSVLLELLTALSIR